MGKFSGILLCTDFDGTLAYNAKIVESNLDKIEYFKNNGGAFSLITGRNLRFVKEEARGKELFNAYVGCNNGMLIYDPVNDRPVCETFMSGDVTTPVLRMRERYADRVYPFYVVGRKTYQLDFGNADFASRLNEALSYPTYKLYAYARDEVGETDIAWLSDTFGEEFTISLSSPHGIEIQSRGFDKGFAARRIAELTGAKLLVCVGDYGNDAPMLKAADIGYAVGNATEELKAIADRVAADCKDGAIADVIKSLEDNVINRRDT